MREFFKPNDIKIVPLQIPESRFLKTAKTATDMYLIAERPGDYAYVENGSRVVTLDANPCSSGILKVNNRIVIFHSLEKYFSNELQDLISRASGGIAGGGEESVSKIRNPKIRKYPIKTVTSTFGISAELSSNGKILNVCYSELTPPEFR